MKNILCFFIFNVLFISLGNTSPIESISYPSAVSQSGRFKINDTSPLVIDIKESSNLTEFLAFQELSTQQSIFIGGIANDEGLNVICEHPIFLKNEKIADLSTVTESDIQYFNTNLYSGCQISIDENRSALIIERTEPFVNQNGELIKYIGLISTKNKINNLKHQISFQITATDFFVSMLQLSQAFSPFGQEINWNTIKQQGTEWIGEETELCKGLSATTKFLIPILQQYDFHSSVSLKGLGSDSCPNPAIPEDKDLLEWLSLPELIRNPILKYTSDFHGRELNGNISYLYIPPIEALDRKSINQAIEKGRKALLRSNISKKCGLIIDLRYNHGGNLQAMLLTLGGILPAGNLFSIGENTDVSLSQDGNQLLPYGRYDGSAPKLTRSKPVAIITNWMTNSSGELTRLALGDNMPLVKVFGSQTGPSASANATFYLLDGNTLNLMVERIYNNQHKIVPLKLPVDEEVRDNLETIFNYGTDESINAAATWLKGLPQCRESL